MGPGGAQTMFTPQSTEGVKLLGGYDQGEGPTRAQLKSAIRMMVYDQILIAPEMIEDRYAVDDQPVDHRDRGTARLRFRSGVQPGLSQVERHAARPCPPPRAGGAGGRADGCIPRGAPRLNDRQPCAASDLARAVNARGTNPRTPRPTVRAHIRARYADAAARGSERACPRAVRSRRRARAPVARSDRGARPLRP